MQAIVYYRYLSTEQVATVNRDGWDCDLFRAYLDSRDGKYAEAIRLGLMQAAAVLDRPDAESVWRDLQNVDSNWSAKADISCLTDFPRSMDLGDVIEWADGKRERVAAVGFEDAGDFRPPGKAKVGPVVDGDDDVLESLADEARRLWVAPALVARADAMIASRAEIAADNDVEDEGVDDQRDELIEQLATALDEAAPPYCTFGKRTDVYGFWPSMQSIEELPRVEDSDGAKAFGEDCKFVNDHGNVTVYGGDGSVLLEIV